MSLKDFLDSHPVFTIDEIANARSQKGAFKSSTLYNLLAYHQKQGHIVRIRGGLYCTVPIGIEASQYLVDPFLVASKMSEDAVLGYRTALDLFGKLHTPQNEFNYLSKESKTCCFQDVKYRAVSFPIALQRSNSEQLGAISVDRLGQKVFVTSLERTLVDVLDRPYLCGSWEEIWLSLESIEYVDLELVLEYAFLLGKQNTLAKLGFFLELHREQFMVPETCLQELLKGIPKKPFYLDPNRNQPQKMVTKWNLIAPLPLLNEEPYENI